MRLLVAPLSALAASVLYFELKALRGEPVLARGEGGELTPVEQPAGGPAPTPAEPPPPPPPPPGRKPRRRQRLALRGPGPIASG